MKKIDVIYNSDGYIESVTDNSMHFEQENDCLVINATIETDKKVRAYLRASNGNSLVTEEIEPEGNVYSLTVSQEYMAKGSLYAGFELYDGTGYIERLEPLKVYIDSFVSLGGGSSDNVYVVTIKVGNVETLENGEPARVENVGTKKDMILNFGLPRGEQGIKGDKGDKGDTGPQGERGIQGVQGIQGVAGKDGKDGYTPVKGVDYFTPADIESLGINDKAGIDYVDESVAGAYLDLDNKKADKGEVEALKGKTFDYAYRFEHEERYLDEIFDDFITNGIYKIYYSSTSDDESTHNIILSVTSAGVYGHDGYEGEVVYQTKYDDGYIEQRNRDIDGNWSEWSKVSVSSSDVTKEINKATGDIETALDTIISMQNSLIGGDGE